MVVDALLGLPRWVYLGVAAGAVLSGCVAVTFLVGVRRFPDAEAGASEAGAGRSTEAIRRAEIRAYLGDIGERYAEDAVVAGNRVAFFLPQRDVAVTFDARTFLALEPTATDAILVEHEMPGVALGRRLPFETPEPSVGPGRAREVDGRGRIAAPEAAFEVLGLPSGADEAAVRRAYRRRVKEVHPDHGGDEREFKRLQEAYDAARRDAS